MAESFLHLFGLFMHCFVVRGYTTLAHLQLRQLNNYSNLELFF